MGVVYIAAAQLLISTLNTLQQQEAQRQQIANANRIAQENADIATKQFNQDIAILNEKNRRLREQEQETLVQASDMQLAEQVQALEATGTQITSTGEAGVEGISPYLQLQDIDRQQLKNIGVIKGNVATNLRSFDLQKDNLKYDAQNAYYTALGRINSVQGSYGQSATANALQGATAALDAGTTWYKLGGRYNKKEGFYDV
nr:hypothetical protein [uncultured Mediterranean phage uvMED]